MNTPRGFLLHTVMPCWIMLGVLGMDLTIFEQFKLVENFDIGTPAQMLRTMGFFFCEERTGAS